jgi:hypothetical protein
MVVVAEIVPELINKMRPNLEFRFISFIDPKYAALSVYFMPFL